MRATSGLLDARSALSMVCRSPRPWKVIRVVVSTTTTPKKLHVT